MDKLKLNLHISKYTPFIVLKILGSQILRIAVYLQEKRTFLGCVYIVLNLKLRRNL